MTKPAQVHTNCNIMEKEDSNVKSNVNRNTIVGLTLIFICFKMVQVYKIFLCSMPHVVMRYGSCGNKQGCVYKQLKYASSTGDQAQP